MSKMKVLYGESNEQVLSAEAALLDKAGYAVETAIGRKGVQDALKQGTFDLVILGATLSRDDRHHLPFMVKKANSAIKVAVMHTDGSRHHYVDINTDSGSGMEEMLRKLGSIEKPKAAAAKAGKS
jgi:DNA-binding NtrC family response regulator